MGRIQKEIIFKIMSFFKSFAKVWKKNLQLGVTVAAGIATVGVGSALLSAATSVASGGLQGATGGSKSSTDGADINAGISGSIVDFGIWNGYPPNTPGMVFDYSLIPTLNRTRLEKDISFINGQINWLMTSEATAATMALRRGPWVETAKQVLALYNAALANLSKPVPVPADVEQKVIESTDKVSQTNPSPINNAVSSAGTTLPAPPNYTQQTGGANVGISASKGISTTALLIVGGIAAIVIVAVLLIVLL